MKILRKRDIEFIKEERDRALRDMNKTGDVDSFYYYEGLMDAYNEVLQYMGVEDRP